MNKKILIQKQGHDFFIGRNGKGKCAGLALSDGLEKGIVIEPIRTNGMTGNCMITIPLEIIPELTQALSDHYTEVVAGGNSKSNGNAV